MVVVVEHDEVVVHFWPAEQTNDNNLPFQLLLLLMMMMIILPPVVTDMSKNSFGVDKYSYFLVH